MLLRLPHLLLLLLLACMALPVWAAEPPAPAEADTAAGAPEMQRLVDTLEDETKRKAFIGDLKALIAA